MKDFLQKIIGDEKRFNLQHRILNISLLFGAFISILGIITNLTLDLHWSSTLIALFSLIIFSISYIISKVTIKSKLPTILGFGFLVLFFSPFMWFVNAGSSGGFQYYIFFFLAAIIVITRGNIRLILIGLLGIATLSSMIIEFYHPEYIIPYPSRINKYLDLTSSFIIVFTGITIYTIISVNQYTQANKKLSFKNQLLKQSRKEIIEHKRKIEQQKGDLEQQTKSLQELNETKDRFFSIISHDLKSPFNALLGLTELLQLERKDMSDAELGKLIDLINQSSEQAYNLVLNLLEWSRSQTNEIEFKPIQLNLTKLVYENVEFVKTPATNKGINILIENKLEENYVFADQNMINTVIRNLISNAIKYTENGEIRIKTDCSTTDCKLSISDTGIGISKESMKKLFDTNNNILAAGTKGEKGTGLGLVLCKEFIEKNQGELFVESTVNKGSTFSFSLPLFIDKSN